MRKSGNRIGFIGIGAMGTPMAGNLAKAGFDLIVFDTDGARVAGLTAQHTVEVAKDLADLGRRCSIVITMLPDGKIVRRVLCGEKDSFKDCVGEGLQKDATVIDMSSSSPVGTREVGDLLKSRGIRMIDAPVSGGVKRAVTGELAIMAGGDAAMLEACRPILEKLGTQIFHAGPLGAGHAIKALNNYVSAAGLVAACEAVIIGRRFGLDAETVTDILNASTGMNNTTKVKVKQFMLNGAFNAGFSVGLMAKDLRTALEIARAAHGPEGMAAHTVQMWNAAEQALGPAADHTAMFKFIDGGGAVDK